MARTKPTVVKTTGLGTETSDSIGCSKPAQRRTYLVDLNKQSLDSFSLMNMSAGCLLPPPPLPQPPRTGRVPVLSTRRSTNESNLSTPGRAIGTANVPDLLSSSFSKLPFDFVEGSRMRIREKTVSDEAATANCGSASTQSTQFRLKILNNSQRQDNTSVETLPDLKKSIKLPLRSKITDFSLEARFFFVYKFSKFDKIQN